jgi:uncharacterized protein
MRFLTLMTAIWLGTGLAVSAQDAEQGIIVTGEGRVSVEPDMAVITLGVREAAPSAKEAMDQVTASVAAILERLEALGVDPADRQTSQFFLRPMYDNRPAEQATPPEITGYEAGNSVTVRVRELDGLGTLMDEVIDTGANDFNGLNFMLQDDSQALAEARKLAVADARQRAEQLAEAATLSLGNVLRMTENSYGVQPKAMEQASFRGAMDSAIASGEVDVTAQVTMTFSIAP